MEDSKCNEYITMAELEGAIYNLKKESAPGPDFFFMEFFINGGAEIKRKLLDIINQSWEEGVLPMEWRRANVKFLKKLNKTNYNLLSSYRSISLTSVVVKMMERIIKFRLEAFVERFHILDAEQKGFRHFRSTVNALLSLNQDIDNGFNMSKQQLPYLLTLKRHMIACGESMSMVPD
jgi:hypothetical protein